MNQSVHAEDFWDTSSWSWGKWVLMLLSGAFVLATIILVSAFAPSPNEDEDEESYAPGARRNRLDFGNRFTGGWHPASYRQSRG